jgi:hypothetical protein
MTPYEKYRNEMTGEGGDPTNVLRWVVLGIVFAVALFSSIYASGQDLPPGVPLSENVLRVSAGSSVTGMQPPFVPMTRPASFDVSLDQDGTGASAPGLEVQRVVRLEVAPKARRTPGQSRADGVPGSSDARPAPRPASLPKETR